jgi:hypothetical protein
VNEKDGVSVERRALSSGSFVDPVDREKGSKHACVRSKGVLHAPAQSVFDLFIDNDRVDEYNEHCVEVRDVMDVTKQAGVVAFLCICMFLLIVCVFDA